VIIVTDSAYFLDRAIIGFVSIYTAGKATNIGNCGLDVATRQTARFARDARIVGLAVTISEYELLELEFEVACHEKEDKKLRLSINSPNAYTHPILDMTGERYGVKMDHLRESASGSWRRESIQVAKQLKTRWYPSGLSGLLPCWSIIRAEAFKKYEE